MTNEIWSCPKVIEDMKISFITNINVNGIDFVSIDSNACFFDSNYSVCILDTMAGIVESKTNSRCIRMSNYSTINSPMKPRNAATSFVMLKIKNILIKLNKDIDYFLFQVSKGCEPLFSTESFGKLSFVKSASFSNMEFTFSEDNIKTRSKRYEINIPYKRVGISDILGTEIDKEERNIETKIVETLKVIKGVISKGGNTK